jgi:hypothetical protein
VLRCGLTRHLAAHATVTGTRIDDAYHPVPLDEGSDIGSDGVQGLSDVAYRQAVSHTVNQQRRAAYAHAARNIGRFPPVVLAELIVTTLRNKVGVLWAKLRPRARATSEDGR